jgi:hypothetical protein
MQLHMPKPPALVTHSAWLPKGFVHCISATQASPRVEASVGPRTVLRQNVVVRWLFDVSESLSETSRNQCLMAHESGA